MRVRHGMCGTRTYKMWIEKDFKKLDEHLGRLKKEAKKRRDWYE